MSVFVDNGFDLPVLLPIVFRIDVVSVEPGHPSFLFKTKAKSVAQVSLADVVQNAGPFESQKSLE